MWQVDERGSTSGTRGGTGGSTGSDANCSSRRPCGTAPSAFAASVPAEPAPQTATIEEQVATLFAATASREFALRAVLTNVDATMRSKVDETVQDHLGLKLRTLAGQQGRSPYLKESVAPCAPLLDTTSLAGYYNGMVVLFFYPDCPSDAVSNAETLTAKLLELKSAKTGRRCIHHVLALPCGDGASNDAFFGSGRESTETMLRKYWRGAGHPGCHAMSEHPHLRRLLEPLMQAVASSYKTGVSPTPVVAT